MMVIAHVQRPGSEVVENLSGIILYCQNKSNKPTFIQGFVENFPCLKLPTVPYITEGFKSGEAMSNDVEILHTCNFWPHP